MPEENQGKTVEQTQQEQTLEAAAKTSMRFNGEQVDTSLEQSAKERPDNVPEKFWDAEKGEVNQDALLNSYLELEKVKSQSDNQETDNQEADSQSQEDADKLKQEADKKVDVSSIEQEFLDKGELSEDTYSKLAEAGFSKETVDMYIEGRKAVADKNTQKVYDLTAGESNYQSMIKWAADNLSQSEIQSFNDAIATEGTMQIAVEGLYARYLKNSSQEPAVNLGGETSSSTNGYESKAQMIEDMQNPKYKSDPAFRKQVENKLRVSNLTF